MGVFLLVTSKELMMFSFATFLLAFVFLFFIFYRSKREAAIQIEKSRLQLQVAQVEMKALRAQVNPHFMFNALNSIYILIAYKEMQKAGNYVLKLGTLIRKILENSNYQNISLKDDSEVIDLYIQVECMKLNYSFKYQLTINESIDSEAVMVPPMIIQPIVENAIWHGLKNRKDGGLLTIFVDSKEDELIFEIRDNGCKADAQMSEDEKLRNAKRKSMGMQITRERLDIINQTNNANARIVEKEIIGDDGSYQGKIVQLYLPLLD